MRLMRLYKIYYRIVGAVILSGRFGDYSGAAHVGEESLPPNVNLYVLYLINLLTTVVSYWLFAYKTACCLPISVMISATRSAMLSIR